MLQSCKTKQEGNTVPKRADKSNQKSVFIAKKGPKAIDKVTILFVLPQLHILSSLSRYMMLRSERRNLPSLSVKSPERMSR